MEIKNIIVHEVKKEEDQVLANVVVRNEENVIDAHAEELSAQLSKLFRKTGLNTGQFIVPEHDDDPKPHFVTLLENYYDGVSFTDFTTFSQSAARQFGRNLTDERASKGGYLWLNHYEHNGEHFLSVVLLRKKFGLSVSSELTLDEIEQIDLDKLHMAARINLSVWIEGTSNKFIAFRIGRGAKDVTDYFSKFIGCEQYTRAKTDTLNLVSATKDYCEYHNFSDSRTEDVRQFVFEQCVGWMSDDVPVTIENLSTSLDSRFCPEESGRLLEIAQNEPYFLNNEIPIEKSSLRRLVRYTGKSRKLSLSFDSDLLNVSVFFDRSSKDIRITELPQNLISQLSNDES